MQIELDRKGILRAPDLHDDYFTGLRVSTTETLRLYFTGKSRDVFSTIGIPGLIDLDVEGFAEAGSLLRSSRRIMTVRTA
jgi:hypothetical protein